MTVFRAFLKILNKNKTPIIMFTIMLVIFGILNFTNEDNAVDFTSSKPDVIIINEDVNDGITKSFIDYISEKSNIIDVDREEIDDALFYRNVNYVIYIPSGFKDEILNGVKPQVKIKSTGDYQASLADMMVNRYLSVVSLYNEYSESEEILISLVNDTLSKEAKVELTSKLNTYEINRMATYFNFMNYAMLAGLVYVVSLILSSFRNDKIMKRTIVSSSSYKSFNRQLLLSNGFFAIILWFIYMILSYILIGNILFSSHGIIYLINSFVFVIVALVIALLIGTLISNKNAVNGIVNVIALGSSFLCGAFVPIEFMPENVVNMGRILPSYYYINSNELIKTMEVINFDSLQPVIKNFLVLFVFIILFIILINVISKRKRKFA